MARFIELIAEQICNIPTNEYVDGPFRILLNVDSITLVKPEANNHERCEIFVNSVCSMDYSEKKEPFSSIIYVNEPFHVIRKLIIEKEQF